MSAKQQLIEIINKELSMITKSVYPYLFEQLQSQEGKEKVVEIIFDYAVKNQISVSAAIVQLENEFEL